MVVMLLQGAGVHPESPVLPTSTFGFLEELRQRISANVTPPASCSLCSRAGQRRPPCHELAPLCAAPAGPGPSRNLILETGSWEICKKDDFSVPVCRELQRGAEVKVNPRMADYTSCGATASR